MLVLFELYMGVAFALELGAEAGAFWILSIAYLSILLFRCVFYVSAMLFMYQTMYDHSDVMYI